MEGVSGQSLAASVHPTPQPGAGRLGSTGDPQSRALGTSLGMGRGAVGEGLGLPWGPGPWVGAGAGTGRAGGALRALTWGNIFFPRRIILNYRNNLPLII